MSKPEDAVQTQINNIAKKSGKPFEHWVKLVQASGLDKAKAIIEFLKANHGFGYGDANLVALTALKSGTASGKSGDALTDEQYAGNKAALKPIYDKVVAAVQKFGDDVELAPKKTYISLRRSKQFGCVQPMSSRVDIGLNLKGVEPAGRLEVSKSNGMFTHVIKVSSTNEVDADLIAFLKRAYDEA
jgi:predicted transport protein